MTVTRMLGAAVLALTVAFALPASQASAHASRTYSPASLDDHQSMSTQAPAPWVDDDPADSLYRVAREALNRNEYHRAAALFEQITTRYPKSVYAGDAYYYRGFALYRAGAEEDLRKALAALDAQRTKFPKARTISDANELRVRIRGELARHGDVESAEKVASAATQEPTCPRGSGERDDNESDIRTAALNALLQMDSESALPIIKQVLQKRDACSGAMRKKAIFLLSQKSSSETESLLIDVVKNDPSRDVRENAVFWLGQVHTDKAASALEDIATSSADIGLREKAIFALNEQGTARGTALIRRLADASDTPGKVRDQAIFWLGQRHSSENADFLRSLFGRLSKNDANAAVRKNVLFSLSQMRGVGNDKWLLNVALDNSQSDDVRKHALFCAGQAGIPSSDLVAMYDKLSDRELKGQLVWVLSESRDRSATDKLVDIAQKDKDIEMRKKAIFWLGQKNDPRVKQMLIDIITKP